MKQIYVLNVKDKIEISCGIACFTFLTRCQNFADSNLTFKLLLKRGRFV